MSTTIPQPVSRPTFNPRDIPGYTFILNERVTRVVWRSIPQPTRKQLLQHFKADVYTGRAWEIVEDLAGEQKRSGHGEEEARALVAALLVQREISRMARERVVYHLQSFGYRAGANATDSALRAQLQREVTAGIIPAARCFC